MKKILVFIDWYLPGYKAGGPIRSMTNLVGHLSESYEFLIVTRNTDYLETEPYPNIKSDDWIEVAPAQKVMYLSKGNVSIKKFRKIINQSDFDIAYVNGVYSFYFSILPLLLMKFFSKKKIVVAPRGMFSAQGFGMKSFKKKIFVFFSKLFRLYKKSIFHTTSNTESSDIQNLKFGAIKFYQIPNLPPIDKTTDAERVVKKTGVLKLISIARISAEKNTLFALQCLKEFTYNGTVYFDLFGPVYQHGYWNKCKNIIETMPKNIKVTYHGELNNNMVPETLRNYHFLFLPSKGENFGHSILESLLNGCPVLISNKTPWLNLERENVGWDIDLGNPSQFAEKIQLAVELSGENYLKMSEKAKIYALYKTKVEETKLAYQKMFG